MKKLLSLLLALLTLLPLFVACQDAAKQPAATTQGETEPGGTEDPFADHVPEMDLKEWEFTIAAPTPQEWGPMSYDREEDTGDTITSAIFRRNRQLEARFNMTVKAVPVGQTTMFREFQQYAISGEDVIDMFSNMIYFDGKPMITNGYVQPWNDVKYINVDRPWWNKSVTETLSVLGNTYFLAGDINWFTMPEVAVCYFNKEVASERGSVVGDLYQTVRDGKWTFDTAYTIAKQISTENGDGKWDVNDTYGAIQNIIIGVTGFLYAANYQTVMVKEDGLKLNFNSSKLKSIIDYVVKFCYEDHASYTEAFDFTPTSKGIPIFFDNRALLYFDILMHAESFRDQESDFGIIPYPKYDEKQKEYVSYANGWGQVTGLPSTVVDTDRVGGVIEAMCALSRKMIVPAYYERTLMGKIKRDDESEEMLDIIFANVLYDFGICYCTNMDFIVVKTMVEDKSTALTSWWRKNEKKITSSYQELYDYVKNLKEGGQGAAS